MININELRSAFMLEQEECKAHVLVSCTEMNKNMSDQFGKVKLISLIRLNRND